MKTLDKIITGILLVMCALSVHAVDLEKAAMFLAQGDTAFKQTMYRKALVNYQKASRYVADAESLKVKIAKTFYHLGDYPTAMQVINEVLEINSINPQALHVKGRILEATNKNMRALEFYNEALLYMPDNDSLDIDRANVLRKMDYEIEASAITQMLDQKRLDEINQQKESE